MLLLLALCDRVCFCVPLHDDCWAVLTILLLVNLCADADVFVHIRKCAWEYIVFFGNIGEEQLCSLANRVIQIFMFYEDSILFLLFTQLFAGAGGQHLANAAENLQRLRSVRKSHCHVFLGWLDPGQAPLKTLLLMLRQT